MRMSVAVRLALLVLLCGGAAACGGSSDHLLTPQAIAAQVGARYGDPHAVVVSARPDETEASATPMYLMTISGQLRKDGVAASRVSFSALATRLYVWDVRAFDQAGQQVWSESEWGP